MLQTAFAIGNSVAVTIPKRLGVLPGTKYRYVPARKKRIVYEPAEEPVKRVRKNVDKGREYKKYLDYYRKQSGAIKLDMSTREFMKLKKHCHEYLYEET